MLGHQIDRRDDMNKMVMGHIIERRARFVRERRTEIRNTFVRQLTIARAVYIAAVRNGGDVETTYATLLQYENDALLNGYTKA